VRAKSAPLSKSWARSDTSETIEAFLFRLRVARLFASGSNDIPIWRTVRRHLLTRLLKAPGLRIGSNIRLDRSHPELGGRLTVGRQVEIGARTILDLSGGMIIGDGVTLSEDVLVLTHDHVIDDAARHWRDQGQVARPVRFGDGAWVGARATVLGATESVGEGAVIGAASVTTRPVAPVAVVVGVPARVVRYRGDTV
jgi:acetyltransferase-like isoleucine patch superfamily enzyme